MDKLIYQMVLGDLLNQKEKFAKLSQSLQNKLK